MLKNWLLRTEDYYAVLVPWRFGGEFIFLFSTLDWDRDRFQGPPLHKASEPSQVLSGGGKKELFSNKLHPAQANTPQSDLVLELCKQRFYSSPLALRNYEGRKFGSFSSSLPDGFVDVHNYLAVAGGRALSLLHAVATLCRRRAVM